MSAKIERITYHGTLASDPTERGITRSYGDHVSEERDGWSDVAYEAIRAMNHITSSPGEEGIPAPVVYTVLGNMTGATQMLPQLFRQLADGLERSLDHFDVYDHNGDPRLSALAAGTHLQNAVTHAQRMAEELSSAQTAINSQGYNLPDDEEA